jgi:nitrogen fixation NifU-like protein
MPNQEANNPIALDELYRDLILDHYRNPRNKGDLADVSDGATVVAQGLNPSCGDEIQIAVKIDDGRLTAVRFAGQGCSISQSSASMLTDQTAGQPIDRVRTLSGNVQQMLTDEDFDVDAVDIGDLEALQGVARFPVRIKCALLAWKVLEQALAKATGETLDPDTDFHTTIATTA